MPVPWSEGMTTPLIVTHHALVRYRTRFGICGSLQELEAVLLRAWAGPKCCVRIESAADEPYARHLVYVTTTLRLGVVARESPGGHTVYILTTVMEPIGACALVANALAAGDLAQADALARAERVHNAARACA